MSRLTEMFGIGDGQEWMSDPDRNCADGHPDNWFPSTDGDGPTSQARVRMARQLCSGCPVAVQCLQYALDNDEQHGVWAGTTPRERRRLRENGAA